MMELIPRRRKSDVPDLFREMEKAMGNMWQDFPLQGISRDLQGAWTPQLDVVETDQDIKVKADLPGIKKEDIEISLMKDLLTIKGEKKESKEEKGECFHRMERSYGSFYRALRLPTDVVEDKIDAAFDKGVLTITLPKAETSKKKVSRIEIH